MAQRTLEERLNSLEEGLATIHSSVREWLDQSNLPRTQTDEPEAITARPRSQQPGERPAEPEWALSITATLQRLSQELADLKEIASTMTLVPDETVSNESTVSSHTTWRIQTRSANADEHADESRVEEPDPPGSSTGSGQSLSATVAGRSEISSAIHTANPGQTDESNAIPTIPTDPKHFHLKHGDLGPNLIPSIMRCRTDLRFSGKLTADCPLVPWSTVLESLPSATGDHHQLGVRFKVQNGFTSLWTAAPRRGSLQAIPVPPDDDLEYRQDLEAFLDNVIGDPPKTVVPYYVGPSLHYKGMLTAGIDLEKLPQLDGVNKHYIHIGDCNSGTAFHREDGNLRSCNLTLYGIKVWILISTDDNDKFESLARAQARTSKCAQFVRHRSMLVPPTTLRDHGIKFHVCCTGPGEMILTDPGQYHAVINRTSCLATSINFTLPGDSLGIDGLAVCADCGLYSFSAQGLKPVKVDGRDAADAPSPKTRSIVPQKREAEGRRDPDRRGTRPKQGISTAPALFALKQEVQKALQYDGKTNIPTYDADSPPSQNVFKLALALRGRASVRQLCGLVEQRRDLNVQRPLATVPNTNGATDEEIITSKLCNSAMSLVHSTWTGNMGVLKRRLAQIDHHRLAELARGDRQRLSPATLARIREESGLTNDNLKWHTQRGRLWAALCDPLPGLVCLIPLWRHGTTEQPTVTSGDYTSLDATEQESLRKLMDDEYGRTLCSASAALLESIKGNTADIEFLWENHPDVCMDTCQEQDMLRLIKPIPYRDDNIWVPGKYLEWQRPNYWPETWSWPADPTSTQYKSDHPSYCEGLNCDCLGRLAGTKPLIRSYGKKGRGLQAVADSPGAIAYKKGDVLGVLTGEILPPGTYEDDPWTLDFVRPDLPGEPVVCQIRSADMGSHFRLLNAATTPCASFQSRRRSDRYITAVVALRDIMDGEEITVSCGQSRTAMEEAGFVL